MTPEQTEELLALARAGGARMTDLQRKFGEYPTMAVLSKAGFGWDKNIVAPRVMAEPEAAAPPDTEAKAKAARKKHKLGDEVPTPMTLYATGDWRRYPGMPDVLIHRDQIAVVQRVSRRRGVYFKTLPRRSFNQKDFWHHYKGGKRAVISVKRAMYECGFWQRKKK